MIEKRRCVLLCVSGQWDLDFKFRIRLADALLFPEFIDVCLMDDVVVFKWLTWEGNRMH